MRLPQQEYGHPTQASRVRLRVFPQGKGFLVTEERQGTVSVYRTLGLFDEHEAAEACLRRRAEELVRQGYQKVTLAA